MAMSRKDADRLQLVLGLLWLIATLLLVHLFHARAQGQTSPAKPDSYGHADKGANKKLELVLPSSCLRGITKSPESECHGPDLEHMSCSHLVVHFLKDCGISRLVPAATTPAKPKLKLHPIVPHDETCDYYTMFSLATQNDIFWRPEKNGRCVLRT